MKWTIVISNVYFSYYIGINIDNIVNEDEVLKTPKRYLADQLYEWRPASIVLEVAELPGEMGNLLYS